MCRGYTSQTLTVATTSSVQFKSIQWDEMWPHSISTLMLHSYGWGELLSLSLIWGPYFPSAATTRVGSSSIRLGPLHKFPPHVPISRHPHCHTHSTTHFYNVISETSLRPTSSSCPVNHTQQYRSVKPVFLSHNVSNKCELPLYIEWIWLSMRCAELVCSTTIQNFQSFSIWLFQCQTFRTIWCDR